MSSDGIKTFSGIIPSKRETFNSTFHVSKPRNFQGVRESLDTLAMPLDLTVGSGHNRDDHGHIQDDHDYSQDDHGHCQDDRGANQAHHGHYQIDHGHNNRDHGNYQDDHDHNRSDHGHNQADNGNMLDNHGDIFVPRGVTCCTLNRERKRAHTDFYKEHTPTRWSGAERLTTTGTPLCIPNDIRISVDNVKPHTCKDDHVIVTDMPRLEPLFQCVQNRGKIVNGMAFFPEDYIVKRGKKRKLDLCDVAITSCNYCDGNKPDPDRLCTENTNLTGEYSRSTVNPTKLNVTPGSVSSTLIPRLPPRCVDRRHVVPLAVRRHGLLPVDRRHVVPLSERRHVLSHDDRRRVVSRADRHTHTPPQHSKMITNTSHAGKETEFRPDTVETNGLMKPMDTNANDVRSNMQGNRTHTEYNDITSKIVRYLATSRDPVTMGMMLDVIIEYSFLTD